MSNRILHVEGPMWWISVLTNLFITWAIVGFAHAFGAMYADFKEENKTGPPIGAFGTFTFS